MALGWVSSDLRASGVELGRVLTRNLSKFINFAQAPNSEKSALGSKFLKSRYGCRMMVWGWGRVGDDSRVGFEQFAGSYSQLWGGCVVF